MNYKLRQFIDGWTKVDTFLLWLCVMVVLVCVISWEAYSQPIKQPYIPIQPRGVMLNAYPQIDGAASTTTLPAATNIVPVYVKDKECLKLMSGLICN